MLVSHRQTQFQLSSTGLWRYWVHWNVEQPKAPSAIGNVNNRLIKWTFFDADDFSYMLVRAAIRLAVVFSFAILNATLRDNDNRITPKSCLTRSFLASIFHFGWFISCERLIELFVIQIILYRHLPKAEVCTVELSIFTFLSFRLVYY
jgi:hypothetical protein